MKKSFIILGIITLVTLTLHSCSKFYTPPGPYEKPLEIVKLDANNYLHTSFIKTADSLFIPCNGYMYVNNKEAVIVDSPLNDSISSQFIDYVQNDMQLKIKAAIFTHSHYDAAGGFTAFAKAKIPTYTYSKTVRLIQTDSFSISHSFTDKVQIPVGTSYVEARYFGEGHTSDNSVVYVPDGELLFGGCLVKPIDGATGNIKDANLSDWSKTISNIKTAYPKLKTVIPGHGTIGNVDLLDYTEALFTPETQPEEELARNLD